MMNLKTKEKEELEHDNKDLKPGSKVALVVLNEWEVQRHQGEDDYVMQTLVPDSTGNRKLELKKFPSPNLEIADNQMRNNISETIV